jgi:hypothetical protein
MNMNVRRLSVVVALALVGLWCETSQAVLTGQYLMEGNANDTSGFDRHGGLTGTPTAGFTGGLYQGSTSALLQNNASQSVMLPSSTDFIRNAPGATLMAWVRPDDLSGTAARNVVVVNNADTTVGGGTGAGRAIIEFLPGTGFRAIGRQTDAAGGGSVTISGGTAVIGTTYFLAGVFDYVNADLILYINGQQVASNLSTGWNGNSADTANLVARIGGNATGAAQSWGGAIDGVRIFNTTMTATDILNIYNAETFPPPLAGDTDNDGMVELEDLDPIRTNWRQTGQTRLEGNLSGDTAGLVDFADFRQWKTAILAGGGSLTGLDLGFVTVPEPSAFVLAVLGLIAVGVTRRRCGCLR